MGMYDTVMVPCPVCGTKNEFQSKSGPCDLGVYELHEAPLDVLLDVNRHSPCPCDCGNLYSVKLNMSAAPVAVNEREDE